MTILCLAEDLPTADSYFAAATMTRETQQIKFMIN
jgi:hypothetical protein